MLKSIHKPTHLRNFSGKTIGIDAYGWLHRGTVACAIDLAQDKPTRKYVDFAMNRVRMLIHFGVKPYLVFDGDYLPSNGHTEKDREAKGKQAGWVTAATSRQDCPSPAGAAKGSRCDTTHGS
jgi:exonuclease-1